MFRGLIQYVISFLFLVALQVFILNKIQFSGFVNPFMYIVFILLLPFDTPKWLLLFLSFALGITIDLFSDTPGMHASATVFLGFLRPYILKSISPREGYESASEPRIKYYGVNWFIKYTLILTFLHHAFLFGVEIFKFSGIFHVIARTFVSTIFTSFLIVTSQYLINRRS